MTCGAGAALTLAAAACLAGNRPEIMDQLPDVSACARNEIIFPIPGPFDYDHAIRLSGAKLVLIDYRATDALQQIEQAITPRTAAIGFVWLRVDERPDMTALADLAHRHGLPLIVDAACALPPMENLTAFSPVRSRSGGLQRRQASRRTSGIRNPVWPSGPDSQCLGSDGGHGCARGNVVAAALDCRRLAVTTAETRDWSVDESQQRVDRRSDGGSAALRRARPCGRICRLAGHH